MGLDMYLYRATRKNIEDLKHIKEVENDLNKMWEPIIANELPKNYWFVDKFRMTEHQRKLIAEINDEFDIIDKKRWSIINKMDRYIGCWRNFNSLHEYIVNNFADGIDDCREINLTKDNVVQILSFLNRSIYILSYTNKNWNISNDDLYANINKAIGIFSMVIQEWDDNFGVWYLAF